MSATDATASTVSARDVERQLVVFSLHGEDYALPITCVREIIRYMTPKATGAATGAIQGMICLRGHVLPIADLSGRMGRELILNDATRILVVEASGATVGLIVDTVDEVLMIPADQIEAIPFSDDSLGEEIAKLDDRLITIVDPERALADAVAA